jgi:hypothetical protein
MNRFKSFLKLILIMGTAMTITACSKTVQWEEEVPLNTGETIWVKRTVEYKLKGAGGNPFDMAYRPDWTETLEFMWQGKKYSYRGKAWIDVLAISPFTKEPVLVAWAANKDWHFQNNYRCTVPFYVQFIPDSSGRVWIWPTAIESWLYGTSYNMMRHKPETFRDAMPKKYSHVDIALIEGWDLNKNPELNKINSMSKSETCFK